MYFRSPWYFLGVIGVRFEGVDNYFARVCINVCLKFAQLFLVRAYDRINDSKESTFEVLLVLWSSTNFGIVSSCLNGLEFNHLKHDWLFIMSQFFHDASVNDIW